METRGWDTKFRGRLVIHAAKKWNKDLRNLCKESPFNKVLFDDPDNLPRGAIIGEVTIVDTKRTEDIKVDFLEWSFGDHSDGRYAWITDPKKSMEYIRTIPWKGQQGFFTVPEEVIPQCCCHCLYAVNVEEEEGYCPHFRSEDGAYCTSYIDAVEWEREHAREC